MVEDPISLSFSLRPRSNISTDKSAAYSSATLRVYLPNSNSFLIVEQLTEKQLVPFLKSLVWLGLGLIRNLDIKADTLPLHSIVLINYSLGIWKAFAVLHIITRYCFSILKSLIFRLYHPTHKRRSREKASKWNQEKIL